MIPDFVPGYIPLDDNNSTNTDIDVSINSTVIPDFIPGFIPGLDFNSSTDPTCYNTIRGLSDNFLTQSEIVMQIFRNSGKDYNDFGRFNDCTANVDFKYYMATIMKKFPIPISFGLCLPKECSLADLDEFKPFLLKVVNAVLP